MTHTYYTTNYKTVCKSAAKQIVKEVQPDAKRFRKERITYIGDVIYLYNEANELLGHISNDTKGNVIYAQKV